jgi:PHP domain protein
MNKISGYIDLHTHSTSSDGTYSPTDVAVLAKQASLSLIALTDHDTMAGVDECFKKGLKLGLFVIPGVEMSCVYEEKEIHILGYLLSTSFSQDKPDIPKEIFSDLDFFAKERADRNTEIIKRFKKDGIFISENDLNNGNPKAQITRAHFSNALINMGVVKNKKEAFEKYLEYGGKYIPVKNINTYRCMEFLTRHNFFISLAHPFQYKFSEKELEKLLLHLKDLGLKGIEVYHSTHSSSDINKLNSLAQKLNLLPTGGSDFHGDNKPGLYIGRGYGDLKIPASIFNDILNSN